MATLFTWQLLSFQRVTEQRNMKKKNYLCGTKDVIYVEVDESRQICITTLTLDNAGVKS